MTIQTLFYRVIATCLLSTTAAAAQQAPLITVHKDDKPPYVSPFDKPNSPAPVEAAAPARTSPRAMPAPAGQAQQMATTATNTIDGAAEESPKKYRGTARQRYRQKMADMKRMREEEAAQLAATQGMAGQPAPVNTHTPAVTTPIATPTVQPLPMASTHGPQQAQQYPQPSPTVAPSAAVVGTTAAVGAAILHNQPQAAATNSPLTVPADIGDMTAANSTISAPPVRAMVQVPTTAPPVKNHQTVQSSKDWFSTIQGWFTPMIQAVMAGVMVLIIILGYVIKKTFFKTDPAFTDPWFKPAK